MISYGCIVPHSPTLYAHDLDSPGGRIVRRGLEQIALDCQSRSVNRVLSISAHPRYQRNGFSAYIAPQYTLSSRDLGDLGNESPIPVDFKLWTAMREASLRQRPILHPIDEPEVDFSHALPLRFLLQNNAFTDDVKALCLNDYSAATNQERHLLGEMLRQVLSDPHERYAVLISTECQSAVQPSPTSLASTKEANLALRYAITSFWSQSATVLDATTGILPCTAAAGAIAKPLFGKDWRYEEILFEHADPTSILLGRLTLP